VARTVRKVYPPRRPWTLKDVEEMGTSWLRGVTLRRYNARLNKDHGSNQRGFNASVRRMFNRLLRAKQNQALRKDPEAELLPHRLEAGDKWNYD